MTNSQSSIFATVGAAHRYCKKHGLDISMTDDQLFSIAVALYNASESYSILKRAEPFIELASTVTPIANKEGFLGGGLEAYRCAHCNLLGPTPESIEKGLHFDSCTTVVGESLLQEIRILTQNN